ncbi:hypothetical protein QVD17_25268 [Tagetes erecta]|uniref:CLAVATA3/ESR (CLE)-related protein 13 n=1 Tax=Tagetes erecta TaxID=13708 RepID=A0AAD8KGI4_TARER|nr:hypothetical protein QVD17_25268 [Tagetes erecta]
MVARDTRSLTTLTALISLLILLLWYSTTTTTFILSKPPPTTTANTIVKEEQQDRRYGSLSTRRTLTNKKTLTLSTKFDFTPFIHSHQHHHHHHRHQRPLEGSEIDTRYGVEARLVPTGPNPLHH